MVQAIGVFILALTAAIVAAQLPPLHKICQHTFASNYGCGGSYNKSALFVRDIDVEMNSPLLLLDGVCGERGYFEAMMAGNDIGFISDLGVVALENITASAAFNLANVVGEDNSFETTAVAVHGHSYAAWIARSDLRSLLAFTVHCEQEDCSTSISIQYSVLQFATRDVVFDDRTFNWTQTNVGGPTSVCYKGEPNTYSPLYSICPGQFDHAYSCGSADLTQTALKFTNLVNDVQALWNGFPMSGGGCSDMYLEAALAGDDMALIADVGDMELTDVSAWEVITNKPEVYRADSTGEAGHTYVILKSTDNFRSLFAVRLLHMGADGKQVHFAYANMLFEILKDVEVSPGFDWSEKSSADAPGVCFAR